MENNPAALPFTPLSTSEAMRNPIRLAKAMIKAIRLKQATKNLFLFGALVFAGKLFNAVLFGRVVIAFVLFTLVAGSVYVLNDLLDVEQDRMHPKKCRRPIASGELPVGVAWVMLAFLSVGSLAACYALHPRFALVALAYFIIQIAYCFYLKHQVLLDVFTIAAGFMMRTIAGAIVINVSISHWLLLCTLQLALFLGFGKRRQELVLLGEHAGRHRAILNEYSLPFLDQMINIVCAVTIVCYSVYSIESETAHKHPHLYLTVPIVIYSVCRYLYLVYQKGWGGAPDEVLMKDRVLQVTMLLWFGLVMLLFAFDKTIPGL